MFTTVLDEAILVREFRRWRTERRWMAFLVPCGLGALLFASAYSESGWGGQTELARFLGGILTLACLLALFQSREVLAREIRTQALESLLLTLQKDQLVMRSVSFSGTLAGAIYLLLFVPMVFIVCLRFGMGVKEVIGYLLLTLACVFACSAIGTASFFLGNGLYSRAVAWWKQVVLLTAVGTFMAATSRGNGPDQVGALLVSDLAVCLAALVFFVSCAALLRYAFQCRASACLEILTILTGLVSFSVISGASFLHESSTHLSDTTRILELLCPIVQAAQTGLPVAVTTGASRLNNFSWLMSMTASGFLVGSAVLVKSYELYGRLRSTPERTTRFDSTKLKVLAVGRDDWRGFGNPLLTRELRTRLRSGDARTFILAAAALSLAAATFPLIKAAGQPIGISEYPVYARNSFISLGLMHLLIVYLVAPGVASETIAGEKERNTFEMLLASRLRPDEILRGKVSGVLLLLALLLCPALPLLTFVGMLHASSGLGMACMALLSLSFAAVVSVICVSLSAICKSTVIAKWSGYTVSLIVLIAAAPLPALLVPATPGWPEIDPSVYAPFTVLLWLFIACLWVGATRSLARRKVERLGGQDISASLIDAAPEPNLTATRVHGKDRFIN